MPQKTLTKKQTKAKAPYADRAYRNRTKNEPTAMEVLTGSKPVTIRMATADLEHAKQQAARKGLRYQTYVKSLLHEALMRESSHRRRS